MTARALINVPPSAKRGEVITIRALVPHVMETGFRTNAVGRVPRNIIDTFVCRYNGEEIFRAALYPSIAANPFLTFHTVATESGKLTFTWSGDGGFSQTETATIAVE